MELDAVSKELVALALCEDGNGVDVTSRHFVEEAQRAKGVIAARQEGVLAGTEVAREVFGQVSEELEVEILEKDGTFLECGQVVMRIEGPARALLRAERVALNFLQRLSGVASLTAQYVAALGESGVRLLDTRKTTPGWRQLEKAAVRAGGGTNHRMSLADRVMVKDNHLLAGRDEASLARAMAEVRRECPGVGIELEADHLEQVRRFLPLQPDHLLLDNMSLEELSEAVSMRGGQKVELEASGGVTLETIGAIAQTGVDAISVGALTHSAVALDLGMDFLES